MTISTLGKISWSTVFIWINTLERCSFNKWAATWQNQQNECASSENSDQPGHPPVWSESSLSAWTWRNHGSLATQQAHSEDWSDWVDAKADLCLRWMHTHFVCFVMSRLKWLLGHTFGQKIICFDGLNVSQFASNLDTFVGGGGHSLERGCLLE